MGSHRFFHASLSQALTNTFVGAYDSVIGVRLAYGLRRMFSSYTGKLIRVQRSSDGTLMDIGYLSDGSLDTVTLATFVGGGNGLVTIWYDQSGLGYNATALNVNAFIVQAGVIYTENGKPTITVLNNTTGSQTVTLGFDIPVAAVVVTATAQVHSIHRQLPTGGNARAGAWRIGVAPQRTTHKWLTGNTVYDAFMETTEIAVGGVTKEYSTLSSISATRDSTGVYSFYDSNILIGSAAGTASNTPTNASFPDTGNGDAVCAEFIFFGAITSAAIAAKVDSNMRSYYSII